MTREEAISILKNAAFLATKTSYQSIEEAVNVVVEALKAQDATDTNVGSNGDTIYRQMAIDVLMEILDRPNHAEFLYTDEICRALGQLPSAQPEIIGCKDCQHRGDEPIADGRYWCKLHGTFMYYCSDAERRTDERVN